MTRLWMTWHRMQRWSIEQALRAPTLFRQRKDERGADILVYAVMTALLVAAAIVIVRLVIAKSTTTVNNIQTQ